MLFVLSGDDAMQYIAMTRKELAAHKAKQARYQAWLAEVAQIEADMLIWDSLLTRAGIPNID